MFDHDDRMALGKKFLKGHQKEVDIGHVETCGGFVKDEEILPLMALSDMLGQFQTLRFPPAQRIGGLAEGEIA